MMAPLFFFALFALFHPVHLYNPEGERVFYEKSCPSFRCLGGGETMFPYRNATAPDFCGPFVVEGCDKDVQIIQLEKGGRRYEVKSISQGNTISVTDNDLKFKLENRSCQSFNSLGFPNLTYAAFHITSKNLTIFKCEKSTNNRPDELDYLLNYTKCKGFNIYYTNRHENLPSPPPNCSIIHLPGQEVHDKRSYEDIFGLLTANFTLDVGFLPACYWCSLDGGTCSPTRNGQLKCIGGKSSKKGNGKLGWELGVGGLGLGFFASITILLLFYLHKRKHNLVSANTSSDTFSQSNMEESSNCFGVPIFSNSELEKATNNFHPEHELGDGGFGTVYYGKLQDGQEVAIKRLYEHSFKRIKQFMNEIKILTNLSHKNLVTLYGCSSHLSRELLLVYEYIPNGTVSDHLHGKLAKTNTLAWPIRMKIAIETASALAYLHASEIIHRDVKTNNILLDNRFCVKVADFGLSRLFPNDVTHVSTAPQGTPGYVDPEYYHCYQLTDRSDVYSFGVVLIELITSMPAVDVTRHRHEINLASLAINRIQKGALDELIDPCIGYNSDEEVKRMTTSVAELAFLCLQQEKEMRPSMNEVLEGLKGIENGENESETNKNEAAKRIGSASPPPDCIVAPLLKNIQPSCSPVSVAHKWVSSSSSSSTLPKLSKEEFFDTDLVFKDGDETTG